MGWPCYVRQPDKRRLGPRCYIFVANPFPPSRSTARQRLAAILKGMRPPASDPRTDRRDLLLAAGIFVLIDVVAAATQPLIDVAGGRGWDGATYYQVAQQLAAGIRPIADAPFVYRLGTPALAALLTPNDLFSGFVIVNAAANALTAMLVFLWLRRFIASSWIRLALFVSFVAMWHGPIRFFHFYPVSAEHLTYAANVIGLLVAYAFRDRISWRLVAGLGILTAIGVAVRETALLAAAALPFLRNPLRRDLRAPRAGLLLFVPVVAGVAALLIVHSIASQTNSYGFLSAITFRFAEKNPLVYVLGWWNAYGPILIVPIVAWRRSLQFLRSHQMLAAFLGACAALGWVGGQDTERYVFWAAPIVYLLVGDALPSVFAGLSRWVVVAIAGMQAFAERVGVAVPQPSTIDPELLSRDRSFDHLMLLTPIGGNVDYFDLWSFWMPRMAKTILLAEYAALLIIVAALVYWRSARARARRAAAPI